MHQLVLLCIKSRQYSDSTNMYQDLIFNLVKKTVKTFSVTLIKMLKKVTLPCHCDFEYFIKSRTT